MPTAIVPAFAITLYSEAETLAFGESLSRVMTNGHILFLEGELGAGKTTCVRGILRGFGFKAAVKSPTYTLVEEYDFDWGNLFHFDLYRVQHPKELEDFGFREYIDGQAIILVEWALRGIPFLPEPDIELQFSIVQTREATPHRIVVITAKSQAGQKIATELSKKFQTIKAPVLGGNS